MIMKNSPLFIDFRYFINDGIEYWREIKKKSIWKLCTYVQLLD